MARDFDRVLRFPRTMEEAFGNGPHNRGGVWEQPAPLHPHDKVVLAGCGIALAAFAALVFFGVIKL